MTNNRGTNVRKRPSAGREAAVDARVERSRQRLGAALVELILERGFDDVTVQEVLDRADVGRATFYAHFRNKNDLLLSDYEKMLKLMDAHLESTGPTDRRVAPVGEFFTHLAEAKPLIAELRRSGQAELIWEIGVGHFARLIERRLATLAPAAPPMDARFFAGAMFEMLKWWLDRDERPTATAMDARYHELVWRAIA